MKKRVLIFLWLALFTLAAAPIVNLTSRHGQIKEGGEWWRKDVLYNFDFVSVFLNRFLYAYGISTDPNEVIIGKEDWLYLGDQFENAVSIARRGGNTEDAEAARIIATATKSWDEWLNRKGVKMFRVMLSPDKNTVYPEFLPHWAQPAPKSSTDTFLANVDHELYVDTRPALLAAKSVFSESLYYKTDSHWNSLGAWVSFRALQEEIARSAPELRLLSDNQVSIMKVSERQGGDLAKFLRLTEVLRDREIELDILSERPIETEQYDFNSGELKRSGGNQRIDVAKQPLLIKSKYALNQRKVLWLRDSFGTAMTPFMAATFSEMVQLHYDVADPTTFARLVHTFKPDYVFLTVVERAARKKWFANLPPPSG